MDKVKIGVLGLRRGFTHLRNFLQVEEAQVIGVADRLEKNQERATALFEERGVDAQVVSEFDELLAMQPDAVVIASNARLQTEHACQALQAGCHVLSEIPGAFTLDELLRLRATVESSGRLYMSAENTCYWDFFRYWRKWYLEGRLGDVSLAEGEYLHYLPHTLLTDAGELVKPSDARGRTDVRPVWRADQPPIQYLTHDLGPLLEVLDDRCVSVTCQSSAWRSTEAPLRTDGQIALFQTAKGRLIKILVTLNTVRPSEHRYRLFGTEGSVEWALYQDFCLRFWGDRSERDGWERVDIGLAAVGEDKSSGHGGADIKMARSFAKAVQAGGPVPIDVYRLIEYSLPGILANQSAELGGQPITIPDLRRAPFERSTFWDHVPLPDVEPAGRSWKGGELVE